MAIRKTNTWIKFMVCNCGGYKEYSHILSQIRNKVEQIEKGFGKNE